MKVQFLPIPPFMAESVEKYCEGCHQITIHDEVNGTNTDGDDDTCHVCQNCGSVSYTH